MLLDRLHARTATAQIGTNALIAIEVSVAHRVKNAIFEELSELEKETLKEYVGQEVISMLFFLAFMGSFSLTPSAWVRLSLVLITKFFQYLSMVRQETVCHPATTTRNRISTAAATNTTNTPQHNRCNKTKESTAAWPEKSRQQSRC